MLKVKIFFAWFDFWVGFYYDRKKSILYFCPFPTFIIAISLKDIPIPTVEYESERTNNNIHHELNESYINEICSELDVPCIGEKCRMIKDGVCQLNPTIYNTSKKE